MQVGTRFKRTGFHSVTSDGHRTHSYVTLPGNTIWRVRKIAGSKIEAVLSGVPRCSQEVLRNLVGKETCVFDLEHDDLVIVE